MLYFVRYWIYSSWGKYGFIEIYGSNSILNIDEWCFIYIYFNGEMNGI